MLPSLLGFATTALMARRRMKVRTTSIDSASKVPPDGEWPPSPAAFPSVSRRMPAAADAPAIWAAQ